MNLPLTSVNKPRVGTCPHGLPLGACPICNGMGGGGGSSSSKARKSGEMSWDECYAVWQQMLKSKEVAQQKRNDALNVQAQINFASKLDNRASKMANFVRRLSDFSQKIQTSNLPKFISKSLATLAKIAIPVLNVLKNIPVLAQNTINFIQQRLADISDKLNAIFGELKNSNEKKISERFKDVKKKIKSLFEVFNIYEVEKEDDAKTQRCKDAELQIVLDNTLESLSTIHPFSTRLRLRRQAHALRSSAVPFVTHSTNIKDLPHDNS